MELYKQLFSGEVFMICSLIKHYIYTHTCSHALAVNSLASQDSKNYITYHDYPNYRGSGLSLLFPCTRKWVTRMKNGARMSWMPMSIPVCRLDFSKSSTCLAADGPSTINPRYPVDDFDLYLFPSAYFQRFIHFSVGLNIGHSRGVIK